MMKSSAIFCVLLLATACRGDLLLGGNSMSSSISSIRDKVESTVESAIKSVETAAENGVAQLTELASSVSDKAVASIDSLQTKVESIVANAQSEIDDVLSGASAKAVESCSGLAGTLSSTATDIMSEATSCVTDKVETAYGYVADLRSEVKSLVSKLSDVPAAASQCVSEATSFSTTVKAFVCVNKQLASATVLSASSAMTVTSKVTKLTSLIGNLQVSLPVCMAVDTVSILASQASTVVNDVRTCVKNMTS